MPHANIEIRDWTHWVFSVTIKTMAESQWYLEVNGTKIGPFALDHIQGLFADGEIKGYHQVTSDQLEGQWISVQELVDSLKIAAPPPPGSESSAPPPPPFDEESEDDGDHTNIAIPILETRDEDEESSPPSFDTPVLEFSNNAAAPPPPPSEPAQFNSDFQPPPRPADVLSPGQAEATKKTTLAPGSLKKTLPPDVSQPDEITPVNDPAISMLSSLQLFKERQEKPNEPFTPTAVASSDMVSRGVFNREGTPPRMWMIAVIAGILLGCVSWGVLKALKNKTKPLSGSITQINQPGTPPPVTQVNPPPNSLPHAPPISNTTSNFRPAEQPRETMKRLAPPRPIVAPSSAPAPVRQFEPDRNQPQIDTAQPNEVPPQPQYAPQYQAYPNNGDPSNPQQAQPYVDPNNPSAPPVYPAGNEVFQPNGNFQNGQPAGAPGMPAGGFQNNGNPPGADNFNPANNNVPQLNPQDQQLLEQQQSQQPQPILQGQPGQ